MNALHGLDANVASAAGPKVDGDIPRRRHAVRLWGPVVLDAAHAFLPVHHFRQHLGACFVGLGIHEPMVGEKRRTASSYVAALGARLIRRRELGRVDVLEKERASFGQVALVRSVHVILNDASVGGRSTPQRKWDSRGNLLLHPSRSGPF